MSPCRFDCCWREAVEDDWLCREHRTIPGVAHLGEEHVCPPHNTRVSLSGKESDRALARGLSRACGVKRAACPRVAEEGGVYG